MSSHQSQKPKVLLLGKIDHSSAQEAYQSLSFLATLVEPSASNRADFLEECRSGALNGVKVIYRTFASVGVTGRIDGEVVAALGKEGLQVGFVCNNGVFDVQTRGSCIFSCGPLWGLLFVREKKGDGYCAAAEGGAGYDHIDVPACTSAGIHVSNVPTATNAATADTAIFLLLGALRSFNAPLCSLRQGSWYGDPPPPLGHDPEDKLLGIIGMGGIGRNLKKKAEAMGMRVQYHNRKELDGDLAGGARYVGFDELLRTSDVISLNLPLNPSTRHLISNAEFSKMKSDIVIINTSRGAVIDEDALVAAIDSGKVFSCGLDVYENEPKVHPGLVGNEKVMLLPHMGTWTVETQTKIELWNISNVRAALETGRLRSPVPEQANMP